MSRDDYSWADAATWTPGLEEAADREDYVAAQIGDRIKAIIQSEDWTGRWIPYRLPANGPLFEHIRAAGLQVRAVRSSGGLTEWWVER